ncbi:sentrin-specific protease 1-like [Temnothorax longispinosus]|uniref:sentrin-specific protease 1-like n=1 Tax=Temnothorax longispinosus TaxID=300112 RepID=UPI003A9A63FC
MLKQASEQVENMEHNAMEELSAWEQINAWEELNTWEKLNEQRCNQIIKDFHNMEAVEGFGLRLTRKDLYTLADSNWLNDEVINFYMNLLIARGTSSDVYPKVLAMNTFFYSKLLSGGHSSLKRWTRKVDIFAQDLVVVPVHLYVHWCMAIIDFRDKTIVYYDSMGSDNPKCLAALKLYLQNESLDKKKQLYDMRDWEFYSAKNIPQQTNGSDCGVFSCMFAEYICANREITFTQDDMPYLRDKMFREIINGKLL